MKIKVDSCSECPFCDIKLDDFAIGNSVTIKCCLAHFYGSEDYIIDMQDDLFIDENKKIPDWCPLKNEKVSIELNKK